METMMKWKPAAMEHMTIRCKNKPNWIRIIILTLAYAVIGWLAFGLFCTLVEGSIGFWQALITPLGLIFLAIDLVTWFINNRKEADN